jgi:hypothetical protein
MLMHAAISFQVTSLHTGKKLQIRYVFAGPELAGLRRQGHIAGKGKHYGSGKNELSEANHLAAVACQSETMVR